MHFSKFEVLRCNCSSLNRILSSIHRSVHHPLLIWVEDMRTTSLQAERPRPPSLSPPATSSSSSVVTLYFCFRDKVLILPVCPGSVSWPPPCWKVPKNTSPWRRPDFAVPQLTTGSWLQKWVRLQYGFHVIMSNFTGEINILLHLALQSGVFHLSSRPFQVD